MSEPTIEGLQEEIQKLKLMLENYKQVDLARIKLLEENIRLRQVIYPVATALPNWTDHVIKSQRNKVTILLSPEDLIAAREVQRGN